MAKILGSTTTYHGTEHPYLNGYRVRIIAVLKNAARPDIDVDGPDYAHISDEDDLARAGGVTAADRLEVGLAPEAAFDEAVRRGTGVRWNVDLTDLITATKPKE